MIGRQAGGGGSAFRAPPRPRRQRWRGLPFVLPALVLYSVLVVGALAHGAWLSLFDWDGISVGTWVGLDNYTRAVSDPDLHWAFVHSLELVAFFSILPIIIALALTTAMSRHALRALTAYRVILFLPQVVATVVVATAWRWIYAYDGPLNSTLRAFGLDAVARPWLGDYEWAIVAVGLVGTWTMLGLCLILFLAGVQQIPPELYDAARVDGAGPLQEARAVTLPALRPQIGVVAAITTVAALKSFDLIYITTRGGPGKETTVPSIMIWRLAFREYRVGSAAAIAVLLTIAVAIVTLVLVRLAEPREQA